MEIEAKLAAADRSTLTRLARCRRLDGWRVEPRRTERLESVYLDTTTGALERARVGCRVRKRGHAFEATIKSGGNVRGSIHRRNEWTVSLAGMPDFPWRLPPSLARRLPSALRAMPLEPILRTSIRRRLLVVRRTAGAPVIAEIALDEVTFRTPTRRSLRRELEIEVELRDGDERDLTVIVRALRTMGHLRRSEGSKLARGLRWARGAKDPGPPRRRRQPRARLREATPKRRSRRNRRSQRSAFRSAPHSSSAGSPPAASRRTSVVPSRFDTRTRRTTL